MANIFTTHNTVYTPMSYEELVAPFIRYKENFDKDTNTLSEYQSNAEKMRKIAEGEAPNDEGYTLNMWNSYNNHLNDIADELMTKGRTMNTIPNMLSLKKRYNSEILPIESAYAKREAMKDYELKNPDFIYQRNANDISLKDIIENPNMNYTNESKKNIYDRAKDQYKAIGEAFNEFASSGYRNTGISFVKEANDRYGITPKQLANAIEGRADSSVYGKIMKMVEDRIFEGTNVYKWTKDTDPLRNGYNYSDQEKMARDIIRSAMPEALGKIQRRQLTDQYGLNLALAREKKKLEDEGNVEPPVVDEYGHLSLRLPGWNEEINKKIEENDKLSVDDLDYTNLNNSSSIENDFSHIYSNVRDSSRYGYLDQKTPIKMFDNDGNLLSFEQFKEKYGNQIKNDPYIRVSPTGNLTRTTIPEKMDVGKAAIAIEKIYNKYIDLLSKKLNEGEYERKENLDEYGRRTITNLDGTTFNINKAKEKNKKDLEDLKQKAYYNYAPYIGNEGYGVNDAFINLVNRGGNTLIIPQQDSSNGVSLNAKRLKSFDRKTQEPIFDDENINVDDIFVQKKTAGSDSFKRYLKPGLSINNAGLSLDGKNVVLEYTDGSNKINHILIPVNAFGPIEANANYANYIRKYNELHSNELRNAYIYKMQRSGMSLENAIKNFEQQVFNTLVPERNAIMDYLFKDLMKEKTQR